MAAGGQGARSEDANRLKRCLHDFLPEGSGLNVAAKGNRGFDNPVTGALLCPTGFDWKDSRCVFTTFPVFRFMTETQRRTQQRLKDKSIKLDGTKWPHFLYEDGVYDKKDVWKGLFRNILIVKVTGVTLLLSPFLILTVHAQAFKLIFTTPMSAYKDEASTKRGNAFIHGMRQITKAALAYIVMQVRINSMIHGQVALTMTEDTLRLVQRSCVE